MKVSALKPFEPVLEGHRSDARVEQAEFLVENYRAMIGMLVKQGDTNAGRALFGPTGYVRDRLRFTNGNGEAGTQWCRWMVDALRIYESVDDLPEGTSEADKILFGQLKEFRLRINGSLR